MDLRQLTALLAVAEHGSFSAAAKALYTVQSNVSTHVARLEKELGVTLVDRHRGVLTEEGAVAVSRARRILNEVDALRADVESLGEEVTGQVRVGVIGSTARWLVLPLVRAMRDRHPRVRLIVVEASTTSLAPQVAAGQLDLGVLNLPVDDPDLVTEPLFEEDVVLVVAADHPLAAKERLALADIAEHPLLLAPQGTALRDDLDVAAAEAGFRLSAFAEVDGMRLVASLALRGFAPALLPATAVPGPLPAQIRRVPIDGLHRRKVGLARRRRALLSAPARALAELTTDLISRQGADQPGVHLL
jgi:LysR family hydrogen peroxide-inducible transcriptional activator